MVGNEDVHRHAVENLAQADALLFGLTVTHIFEKTTRAPPCDTNAVHDYTASTTA